MITLYEVQQVHQQHTEALGRSLDQTRLGYPPDVEVPAMVALPRVVGIETMAALAMERHRHGLELAAHPTDMTKMVITGITNRLY